jgi:hypothetical protein
MLRRLLVICLIVAGVAAYQFVRNPHPDGVSQDDPRPVSKRILATDPSEASETFRCEGKTRCSQMRSCAEAEFYLANCPGTQMDGDHDGVPCESQWCGEG